MGTPAFSWASHPFGNELVYFVKGFFCRGCPCGIGISISLYYNLSLSLFQKTQVSLPEGTVPRMKISGEAQAGGEKAFAFFSLATPNSC
jgi:hypothetical protein